MFKLREKYPRWGKDKLVVLLQEKGMPFPVKAIQVDGGSEFEAIFEAECQKRGINLFVLPPRSPKLNGAVERAHRTHTEEFHEVTEKFLCSFRAKGETIRMGTGV